MSDLAQEEQQVPVISPAQLDALGTRLFAKFNSYKADRKPLEEQWLKNMRQFRGIYDPEIESALPANRSRAYPKFTRKKVIATVSRLMEMLFPQTDKNYGIQPTPLPDLSVADMQALLDDALKAAQAAGQQTPDMAQIEQAVTDLAKARCSRMEKVVDDQLSELDWVTLARKVIFSGVLYGPGVVKGPLVKKKQQTTYRFDTVQGKFIASAIERNYPYFEFLPCWSYYPDLSAKTRASMDDCFERHVMSREQVTDLKDRADFIPGRVEGYLSSHLSGDFVEEWWETQLRMHGDRSNPSNLVARKYLGLEFWGSCTGNDLAAAGVLIPGNKLGESFKANVFMLGNMVVKCKVNPYKVQRRPYHEYIYEEDDISLLGTGLPPIARDSQLAICETTRMALDNASVVCGPILEMNVSLLMPGQNLTLHAYKTFLREDDDRVGVPAVREIKVDSHIPELEALIERFSNFLDEETALPPSSMGDPSKGGSEALRTQGNMSMMMGAAALPIRDTVRNFDVFTQSAVSALVEWNMQFNTDPSIKGDFVTIARGSTSLIAKEVRAYSLDAFKASLTPDEVVYVNTQKILKERAKSRDIPDDVFETDAVVKDKLAAQAQAAAKQESQQDAQVSAQVREILSKVVKNLADAKKADTEAQTGPYEVLMKAISDASQPKPASGARA